MEKDMASEQFKAALAQYEAIRKQMDEAEIQHAD